MSVKEKWKKREVLKGSANVNSRRLNGTRAVRKKTVEKERVRKKGNVVINGLSRGLRNLGNTCFMNAVIQALKHVELFRSYLSSLPLLALNSNHRYYRTRSASTPSQLPTVLVEELRKTVVELGTSSTHAFSPHSLLNTVWQLFSRFSYYEQHDSHEFLRCLLERVHAELCDMSPTLSQHPSRYGLKLSESSSAVSALFEGVLMSEVTCLYCHSVSNKQDPFLDLSLDVPSTGHVTITDCIKSFFDKEHLDACEQFICYGCGQRRPSTKQLFIDCLPRVLCLHLKRFRWFCTEKGKVENMVEFPVRGLDLSSFIINNTEKAVFDLSSVVVHHGSGVASGHYTAFGRHGDSWVHLNDGLVSAADEQTVRQQEAYILFYTRV